MEVISLETDKVKIYNNIVIKKSNYNEYYNIRKAMQKLKNNDNISILNQVYTIIIPKIYAFSDEGIVMERVTGENLEILLRQMNTHNEGVDILNNLLNFLIDNKFFWNDFAPRNIMINKQKKEIYLFDFERGIEKETISLRKYLSGIVYEEYGAFLLPEERLYQIDEVYDKKYKGDFEKINIDDIKSKRVRSILKELGHKKQVTYEQYINSLKMILINEEPYKKNNKIIFPLIELEEFIKKNLYEKYSKKVIGGYYGKTL